MKFEEPPEPIQFPPEQEAKESVEIKETIDEIASKVNFNIEIVGGQENQVSHILLKKNDGSGFVDLVSFLPEGRKLLLGNKNEYDPFSKEVSISPEWNKSRFLINLFHEIGHSHERNRHEQFSIPPEVKVTRLEKLSYIFKKVHDKFKIDVVSTYEPIADIKKRQREQLIEELKYEKIKNFNFADQAQSERGAWAFALHALRQLAKEGYDVFGGFDTSKEVLAYIEYCLLTYEDYRIETMALAEKIKEGGLAGIVHINNEVGESISKRSKELKKEILPIFVKKRKI